MIVTLIGGAIAGYIVEWVVDRVKSELDLPADAAILSTIRKAAYGAAFVSLIAGMLS